MPAKLTIQEAERRCPDMVRGQKWASNRAKYSFICKVHVKYQQRFFNHQTGYGCSKCGGTARLTIREAERRCPDMARGQKWIGARTKYLFICKVHGKYRQRFFNHQTGYGCSKCARESVAATQRLTIKEAERRCPDMARGQDWTNNAAKYLFICKAHGTYQQSFDNHQDGHGCPVCKRSFGEITLKADALSLGISDYETQRRFPDCKNSLPLPFDGASESLKTLFEYHGRQHYQTVEAFGGINALRRTQRHDYIKRNWARRNGWKLIVIPYTIKNIREYIRKRLNLHSQMQLPKAA